MTTGKQSEAEIIARILAGEKELFHELIPAICSDMVYLTVFSVLRMKRKAEDAAQVAVINAYRHWDRFGRTQSQHVAGNDCLNKRGRNCRRDKRAVWSRLKKRQRRAKGITRRLPDAIGEKFR